MDLRIRPIVEDEFEDFRRCDAVAFGFEPKPEDAERLRAGLELDRTAAAFDGEQLVGASAALSWELTVPGGALVPAAAVTWVGVLPTHRRQGVLTAMMTVLLEEARERAEPLAMLLASESIIYGRYGYGLATTSACYSIDRAHTAFAQPVSVPGRFRMVSGEEAQKVVPDVFDRYRRQQPGEVSRSAGWWKSYFDDPEHEREGASSRFFVVHETPSGEVDGYACWRVEQHWEVTAENVVQVHELITLTPETRLALARFLFDIDLATRIDLTWFPVDEPIRWALADPRRLKAKSVSDLLWVRPLDIAVALAARSYATDDRLVLEVHDPFLPANSGRYEVAGDTCRATEADTDLVLGVSDLGAAYLGGTRFSTLAAAGRVQERTAGALRRADAMFASTPAPPAPPPDVVVQAAQSGRYVRVFGAVDRRR